LITNAIVISVLSKRLEKRIEAIRAAGDPVSLADLARERVPPTERNAAVFLRRAKDHVDNISKELNAVYAKEGFSEGVLSPTDVKAIESALRAYPDVVPLLQRAAECPEYDSQPDYTVGPQVFLTDSLSRGELLRAVSRLLAARVYALVSHKDREEALRTCLSLFRLSRHFSDREPMIINYLVSLACRGVAINAANVVLRSGPCSSSSHKALEVELALHDGTAAYVHALKTERVLGMGLWQATVRSVVGWPVRVVFINDECDYLDLFSQQLEFSSRPFADLVAADAEGKHHGQLGTLSRLMVPSLWENRKANDRVRARIRCLRVLNAVLGRAEQGDQSDPKLDKLGLDPDATTDPFTGTPLHLKRMTDGWLVYSAGENLQDDGGDLSGQRDVGVGPIRPPHGNE
jgi:hypothetical protein